MSRRPTYDDILASDLASDNFAAQKLAAVLRPAPHRLAVSDFVQEACSTLRPIARYEQCTSPAQGFQNGGSAK